VLENELQYHGLAVRINSRHDGATSSKNLVNFCLVSPVMTGLICIPIYLYWVYVMLLFRNAMQYYYADGRINSSKDQATSDINLVGF